MKVSIATTAVFLLFGVAGAQNPPELTPATLSAALGAKPEGAEADRLADRIRSDFGGDGPGSARRPCPGG